MTNGAFRNVVGKKSFVKKKRRNILENKENYCDFSALNKHKKNAAEYLYVDSTFITEATCGECDRQQGGEQEVFYDCSSVEGEYDLPSILQQQLQIFDVINEINNAKEFKGLLKQLAFTSNVLYRTFKQAYKKTKKCNQKQASKCSDRGDMNPMKVINCESTKSMRKEKEKHPNSDKTSRGDQKYFSISCSKLGSQHKEKICPKCYGSIEEETVICCEKYPTKPNENENCSGLKETNICDAYEEDLKDLNFCDRCAVLRGEMTLPPRKEKDPQVNKSLSKTRPEVDSVKSNTATQTPKPSTQSLNKKQVLNLNPVCVTIPLKLQIDGQNCQSRFIETEIVMETFGGQTKTCMQQLHTKQKQSSPVSKSSKDKSAKLQQKSVSDTFLSCISDSVIIKPSETPNTCHEKALNEILEMIKKRMPCSTETDLQTTSTNVGKEARGMQTQNNLKQELVLPEEVPPPASTYPKNKANQLRAELLGEVKAALAQTTTLLAIKSLKEGKRFSLPTTLQPKETRNVTPARHSFPTNYQATPTSSAPLRPLNITLPEVPPFKVEAVLKPPIAPKPVKIAAAQTDMSGLKPTNQHYRRNDVRTEIVQELRELVDPNSAKDLNKHTPAERDQILIDLHRLLHPDTAGILSKQKCYENAIEDIHFILEPDIQTHKPDIQTPENSETQETILESVKYILNPRIGQKPRKKKFSKDTKDKILEDLQIILLPHKQRSPQNREARNSVMEDLRFMLDTGADTQSPFRPPRSGLQFGAAPGPSGIQPERQENPQNSNNNNALVEWNKATNKPHTTARRRSGSDQGSVPGPSSTQLFDQESQQIGTDQLKENLKSHLMHLLNTNSLSQPNNNDNAGEGNKAPNKPNTTPRDRI